RLWFGSMRRSIGGETAARCQITCGKRGATTSYLADTVFGMRRLTHDQLRQATLQRQFPAISGTGSDDVLELFARLGPIQSQVPRAPFLTVSSRLPWVSYVTICQLFENHHLLKTTNIRGTVHTSVRQHFGWLDAVARAGRAGMLRNYLKLDLLSPDEVGAEIEAYAAHEWRTRADIV